MVTSAQHMQVALSGLHTLVERDVNAFWQHQDLSDMAQVRDNFMRFVPQLVNTYGAGAATIAADWFDDLRSAQRLATPYRAKVAQVMPEQYVQDRVRFGASSLWTPTPTDFQLFVANIAKGYVTQAFGDTISNNVEADPSPSGWARIPEAGACKWCLMLASRGSAYTSEAAAKMVGGRGVDRYSYITSTGKTAYRGHGRRTRGNQAIGKEFHDSCRCVATPIWDETRARVEHGYDPEGAYQQWQAAESADAAKAAERAAAKAAA